MSKYYTPTIEEFHVGFEFESNYILFEEGSLKNGWNKVVLSDRHNWFYDSYVNDAVPSEFRVKYLDKSDIESLGFIHVNGLVYDLPETNISLWYNFSLVTSSNSVTIRKKEGSMLFDVAVVPVKNKSELKKLLKQLGI